MIHEEDEAIIARVVDAIDTWENRCRKDRTLRSQFPGVPLLSEQFIEDASHVADVCMRLIMEKQARPDIEIAHARERNALTAQLVETRRRLEELVEECERAREFERMIGRTTNPGGVV